MQPPLGPPAPARRRPRAARGRGAAALALLVSTTCAVAGCSGQPAAAPSSSPTTSTPAPTQPVRIDSRAISGSLLPADAADAATLRVVDLLFRGLVRYDAKGKAQNEVAESITTTDDQTYRVTVAPGWSFSDGSPVTAASFVDAWNLSARRATGAYRAQAFAPIDGFEAVRAPAGPVARDTLAGLDIVDARTFTIRLSDPDPTFRDRLGDPAFSPLPPSAFGDAAAFGAAPVGNGPYRLGAHPSGDVMGAGSVVSLVPNPRYTGGDPARNAGLDLHVYADLDAAYADFTAGRLDVLSAVAPAHLADYTATGGKRATNQPVGVADGLVFPVRREPWTGEKGRQRRLAIARAVDRAAHAREAFAGTKLPATDLAAPVVAGSSQDLCGPACQVDAGAAAELAKEAGGLGPLTIAYAADGDQGAQVAAVCGDVSAALSIPCHGRPYPDEIALAEALALGKETNPHLESWHMDRPALASFLDPRFVPGAAANTSGYADDLVATKLRSAATASGAAQPAAYAEVEKDVVADLPVVPLWSANATGLSSAAVGTVRTDAFGAPILTEVTRATG